MARKRFTPEERQAYMVGAEVEWRNGGHWHSGEVVEAVRLDTIGEQCLPLRHTGHDTRTVGKGDLIMGRPTSVRLPAGE